MKKIHSLMTSSALAAFALLLPFCLMAGPIVVRINDVPNAAPVVTVIGAPNGYDLYTGPEVVNPDIEDGGLITLFGVDQFGSINPDDIGWRFVDPSLAPDTRQNAVDIVWIQHDYFGPFGNGDLQVGFNSREDGLYYGNPDNPFNPDENAGPVTDEWVTVYADETIVVQYKPHTYVLRK